jgi:uracil-DNA glycosylase
MNWEQLLKDEIAKDYFVELTKKVKATNGLCPPVDLMFRAFELTPFDTIKVVILGQDPYHGDGQANGLAFSVNNNHPVPPSLINIFFELDQDLNIKNINGDLTPWATQGVLLLNSIMTVERDKPGSHVNLGWEKFTDKIISDVSTHLSNVVFILWGNYAQSKEPLIDTSKHLIIKSSHPSPLSAYINFFDSKPFSTANEYLKSHSKVPIDWRT